MRPAPADKLGGPRWRLSLMLHAPAASLGRAQVPPLGAGRPAKVSPQAQNMKARAAIPALPRPCPVTPPRAVLLGLLTLSGLGAPRTASLSSAASASVRRRSSPVVAVVARPRPVVPHDARPSALGRRSAPLRRHPLRAGGRRRGAPPPALGRALRLLPRVPRPARAGVPAPALADSPGASGAPGVSPSGPPEIIGGSKIEPLFYNCKAVATLDNPRNLLIINILFHSLPLQYGEKPLIKLKKLLTLTLVLI